MVSLSSWIYPWDVARLGVDRVLGEMADCGLAAVDLASTYHSISAFSPRGELPQFFSVPDGAVFFPARLERYRRIQPAVWPDAEIVSIWKQVLGRAATCNLAVNAWTVCLFQPWLAKAYPDCARVMPTGERSLAAVCPAASEFREYLGLLLADLVDQFEVQAVKLEGVGFSPFDYGAVRPRFLAPVPPLARWLLSLCFCPSCTGGAVSRGLDVEAVRKKVVARIVRELASPTPEARVDDERSAMLSDECELALFIDTAQESVASLIRFASQELDADDGTPRLVVSAPREPMGGLGVPVDRVVNHIGGIQLWSPKAFPADAKAAVAAVRASAGRIRLSYFHPPEFTLTPADAAFQEELRAAFSLPIDEVSLYHFGLVDSDRFRAMVQAVRAVERTMQ